MRHLRFLASLALTLLAALPIKAQTENEAFYIYQNDGHFDGFFYDEIVKMNFSFLDTLGIEHGEIVSQEIVTADSTYRIMLSAIDSIGFVQPEIKYNPRMRIYPKDELFYYLRASDTFEQTWFNFDKYTPVDLLPNVGDVFVYFATDIYHGFSVKVTAVNKNDDGSFGVLCTPVTDINDIFQQLITVEEYGYDDEGNLIRRRVAGCPDLTIGKPKRADGTWEGDIFNFSLNGHVPLYATNDLTISLDPSIEGKLHLKTVWNLSWFGDKYIGITSKLKFGVGTSFTVDGKIKDFFPSGIGKLGSIPVPATSPILIINCGPDVFLRGEAHVNFKVSTPKFNGSMWSKLELKNWIPSIDMGFGNSDDGSEFESVDKTSAGITMSLNGFVQGGMLFPLKFKSLPLLRKICDVEVGGQWFVGPKVSADFTLDMTTMPWNDVATYKQLKNITLGLHLMDADFEVKAMAETLAGVSEVTLADGSINLFPPLDVKLVPEFGKCVEYVEDRLYDDEYRKCRIWAFEPQGCVIKPVTIGTALFRIQDDGIMEDRTSWQRTPFFNISRALGQEYDKRHWAEFVIPIYPNEVSPFRGKIKVVPTVYFPTGNKEYIIADQEHEFEYGVCHVETSADTILVNCDGSHDTFTVTGDFDKLMHQRGEYALGEAPDDFFDGFVEATGDKGYMELKFKKHPRLRNLSPINKKNDGIIFYGQRTTEYDEIFVSPPKYYTIWVAPNTCEDPVGVNFYMLLNRNSPIDWLSGLKWSISRTSTGWHCQGNVDETLYNTRHWAHVEFDVEAVPDPVVTIDGKDYYSGEDDKFTIINGSVRLVTYTNNEISSDVSDTFTGIGARSFVNRDRPGIYVDHRVGSAQYGGFFYTENNNEIHLSVEFKSNEEWSNSE